MLRFESVDFGYRDRYTDQYKEILACFELQVQRGEIVSVVGLSGRGKTTVGRLALGLERPKGGGVTWDGAPVESKQHQMSAVFQNYSTSLFGWLSVEVNVFLAIEGRGLSKAERRRRIRESLSLSGLDVESQREGFLHRKVSSLSGGQCQRVAIARAIIRDPSFLVLDEPFASLDSVHRRGLQETLVRLSQARGFAALLVTHDIDEAVLVGDRLVILVKENGRPRVTKIEVERHSRLTEDGLVRSRTHEAYVAEAYELLRGDQSIRES